MSEPRPILGATFPELEVFLAERGHSAYRARQLFHWLYRHGAVDYSEMNNLPAELRRELEAAFPITNPPTEVFESSDGTRKYRFRVGPEEAIEAVWIPDERRKTLCVSSQVGCALQCRFCVTGAIGFKRNLGADEIVAQVRHVKLTEKLPVTNIVFMGMGEPLLNLDAVVRAIGILSSDHGLKIGRRKITLSTVGIVPKIAEFFRAVDVALAVSITGTNDPDRDHWMPINRKFPLKALTDTLRSHTWKKGKKVTFEVVLIHGRTDQDEHAEELARRLKGIPCMVNLIPYNENPTFPDLQHPARDRVLSFQKILIQRGIRAMIRRNRGNDIQAACGQLAGREVLESRKEEP
ncbi:MAG: 23S rRNA (adenine(2503)-C(2))-methyltransferase RlmN [Pseudomonadota bacterium]